MKDRSVDQNSLAALRERVQQERKRSEKEALSAQTEQQRRMSDLTDSLLQELRTTASDTGQLLQSLQRAMVKAEQQAQATAQATASARPSWWPIVATAVTACAVTFAGSWAAIAWQHQKLLQLQHLQGTARLVERGGQVYLEADTRRATGELDFNEQTGLFSYPVTRKKE